MNLERPQAHGQRVRRRQPHILHAEHDGRPNRREQKLQNRVGQGHRGHANPSLAGPSLPRGPPKVSRLPGANHSDHHSPTAAGHVHGAPLLSRPHQRNDAHGRYQAEEQGE